MEKYIIIVLLFFFNPVIGQKIKVVDSQNDPIYNVGFFKKDQFIEGFCMACLKWVLIITRVLKNHIQVLSQGSP